MRIGPAANQRIRLILMIVIVISACAVVAWVALLSTPVGRSAQRLPVLLALPMQPSAGSVLVAQAEAMFTKNNVAMTIRPFALGKQALQSMLNGEADLAVVADTPFMFSVIKGEKIQVLSSIYESRNTMALVSRKDRGIQNAHDLVGKNIGTITGTNAQFFLDQLLLAETVPRQSVNVISLRPDKLASSIEDGSVDAVTIWDPDLSAIKRKMGTNIVALSAGEIFIQRFVLVGTRAYITAHPGEVRQILRALSDSNKFIRDEPKRAQDIIGHALGMRPLLLADAFNPADFTLNLNQPLLLSLGDQARWAMRSGLVPHGDVPNFLNYFATEPLESVQPDAVKLFR